MDSYGLFVASLIDSTAAAHAAGIALCLRERLGVERAAALGSFEELRADARQRLNYLSEAMAIDRPALYVDHVAWTRDTLAGRGLGLELLQAGLECQRQVLGTDLAPRAFTHSERFLAAGEAQVLAAPAPPPASSIDDSPLAAHARRLMAAARAGRREEALEVAEQVLGSASEDELIQDVLTPVQVELGRLWQIGEVSVAEEHQASRMVEDILARLPLHVASQAANGRCVVVASTAGDLHDIGARMVARRFQRQGWRTVFLGANVPGLDLLGCLHAQQADLLALSVTLGLQVRAAAAVIVAVQQSQRRVPVLVGGAPFRSVPDLWQAIGADACAACAVEAESAGRRLLGL